MMSVSLRRLAFGAGVALLLVAISAPGMAQEKKYKSLVVRAPDGVTIAAQEWGNPSGPEFSSFTASRRPRCRGSARSRASWPRNSAW